MRQENVLPREGTFPELSKEEMQKLKPKFEEEDEELYEITEEEKKKQEYRIVKQKEYEAKKRKQQIDSNTLLINPVFANAFPTTKKRKLSLTKNNVWGQEYNL